MLVYTREKMLSPAHLSTGILVVYSVGMVVRTRPTSTNNNKYFHAEGRFYRGTHLIHTDLPVCDTSYGQNPTTYVSQHTAVPHLCRFYPHTPRSHRFTRIPHSGRSTHVCITHNVLLYLICADLPPYFIHGGSGLPADHVRGLCLRARAFEQRPLVHLCSRQLQEKTDRCSGGRPHFEPDDVRPGAGGC